MEEMHRVRCVEGMEIPGPPLPAPTCSPTRNLSESHPFFLMEVLWWGKLINSWAISSWCDLQPLFPPWRPGLWDWNFQSSHHEIGFPGNQLRCFPLCIFNGILHSHKKEWNSAICNNMGRPRKHYPQWNALNTERRIFYDIIYTWNLKNNTTDCICKTETDSQI